MLRAKISELKTRLSAYIGRVRAGETVVILDRKTPVARLVPLETTGPLLVREPEAGVRLPLNRISTVKLHKPVDVDDLLRRDRDYR